MKIPSLAAVLLLAVAPAFAATTFPGLKSLLTEAEWKRAGLDRLTADELGVIDAALIRREAGIAAQHQTEVAQAQQAATANPVAAAGQPAPSTWARFGLSSKDGPDWRDQPPLQAVRPAAASNIDIAESVFMASLLATEKERRQE